MKQAITCLLICLIVISCKKDLPDLEKLYETPLNKFTSNEGNNYQGRSTASIKVDLVEDIICTNGNCVGTGVYRGFYNEFNVVVSGIVNTIPIIRDGDPVYGSITTIGAPYNNESVEIPLNAPSNHFALSRTRNNSGFTTTSINTTGYHAANSAANQAYYNASLIYNNLPPALQANQPRPRLDPVFISNYLVTSSGSSQIIVEKATGKLIRSTTGTSTYALVAETYAVPPPYVPVTFSDDCANAINFGSIGVNSTTITATPSSGSPIPSCQPSGINDDAWFKFTTMSSITEYSISISNVLPLNNMTVIAYSGSCGSLSPIPGNTSSCSSTGILNLTGLQPNTTYFVRVYTSSSSPTIGSNFRIDVVGLEY